jgi:hypothetical protein
MKSLLKYVVPALALAACITPASASLVDTLPSTLTEFNTGTNFFQLDKFDSSLGTLTGVHLVFNSTATFSVQFTAGASGTTITGAGPGPNTLRVGVAMVVKGPEWDFVSAIDTHSILNSAVSGRTIPNQTLAANQSSALFSNSVTPQAVQTTYDIDPNAFSAWQSPGGGTISLDIAGTNSLSNIGNITGSFVIVGSGHVSGDATVSYTYAATPEPVTMGLMGSALLAFVAFRKRLSR